MSAAIVARLRARAMSEQLTSERAESEQRWRPANEAAYAARVLREEADAIDALEPRYRRGLKRLVGSTRCNECSVHKPAVTCFDNDAADGSSWWVVCDDCLRGVLPAEPVGTLEDAAAYLDASRAGGDRFDFRGSAAPHGAGWYVATSALEHVAPAVRPGRTDTLAACIIATAKALGWTQAAARFVNPCGLTTTECQRRGGCEDNPCDVRNDRSKTP